MLRIVAVALAAMAAFDYFALDGRHMQAAKIAALSLLHFALR